MLNKNSSLAVPLGVTKFTIIIANEFGHTLLCCLSLTYKFGRTGVLLKSNVDVKQTRVFLVLFRERLVWPQW